MEESRSLEHLDRPISKLLANVDVDKL
jgi:hypothetical protein